MTYGSSSTVVGVFADSRQAREAIEGLKSAGFQASDIGVLMLDRDRAIDVALQTRAEGGLGEPPGVDLAGWLTGWMLGMWTTAISGVGPLVVAGALGPAVRDAESDSGLASVTAALGNMGIPREEAFRFTEEVRIGHTPVAVRAEGRLEEACRLLGRYGASDLYALSFEGACSETGGFEVREELQMAHQEQARRSELDMRKEVVSECQSIDVPVAYEEVYVERRQVEPRRSDRPVGGDEPLRISVHEEEVHPEKETVVEEVRFGKRQVTKTERISETVSRETVWGQQQGDFEGQWDQGHPAHEHHFIDNRCSVCGAPRQRRAA